jgi:hypothetical protein
MKLTLSNFVIRETRNIPIHNDCGLYPLYLNTAARNDAI